MHPTVTLELNTCILRPLRDSDAHSISKHANNRKIWLNVRDRFPHPYHLDDAADFILKAGESATDSVFAIDVGGAAIGAAGLMLREDVDRVSAEIGYWLGEDWWGRGIATEAVKALTAYAIRQFRLSRVFAITFEWNPASARVLEKAGFVLEGRLRRSAIKDGQIVDQRQYAYVVPDRDTALGGSP